LKKVVLFIIGSIIFPYTIRASDTIELQELNIDGYKYVGTPNNYYINQIPNNKPTYGLDLNIKFDVLRYFYMNHLVHGTVAEEQGLGSQFRMVGWKFDLGLRFLHHLDFYYQHHSQHYLDYNNGGFPVQDVIGFRLYIYKKYNENNKVLFWEMR
jgi:hypothetical protein